MILSIEENKSNVSAGGMGNEKTIFTIPGFNYDGKNNSLKNQRVGPLNNNEKENNLSENGRKEKFKTHGYKFFSVIY